MARVMQETVTGSGVESRQEHVLGDAECPKADVMTRIQQKTFRCPLQTGELYRMQEMKECVKERKDTL